MDISSSIHIAHIPQSSSESRSVINTAGVRLPVAKHADSFAFSDKALAAQKIPGSLESSEEQKTLAGKEPSAGKEHSEDKKSVAENSPVSENSLSNEQLSEDELLEVEELKRRDTEVRTHEQAHMSAAGNLAQGGANFSFETGPDGKRYAVGGDVSIDTSAVAGDPQATLRKAQQIRRAASAPVDPSSQDRSVAAQATRMEAQARVEISQQAREKQTEYIDENTPKIDFPGSNKEQNIQETYAKIQNSSVLQEQRSFVDFFI